MKNVLITGCCGFIGSHLTKKFLDLGYHVYGLDDLSTGSKENLQKLKTFSQFTFIPLAVEEDWSIAAAKIQQPLQFVFHFASPACPDFFYKHGLKTMKANSFGLWNMLELADHFQARLIFASTSEIYGDPTVSPQSESYWGHVNSFGPRSCYDESKRFGEALILNWNKEKNTKHGLVRIFNTYGPGMSEQDQRVIHQFFLQARKNEPLVIYGDGQQTRCFCYVSDLLEGIVRYAQGSWTEPVNLGSNHEVTVLDVAIKTLQLFSQSLDKIQYLPKRAEDPMQRQPNLTRAKQWLNWEPKVSLDEGLRLMKNDQSHHESSLGNPSNTL